MTAHPEARFVRFCVQEPGPGADDTLQMTAQSVRDWGSVAELAIRHRVAAYVLLAAARADVELPTPTNDRLRVEVITSEAVTMLLEAELSRIEQALAHATVPVLILKGPALARDLYADRGLRPYSDLDLVVHESDEARAVEALSELAYTELVYEAEAARQAHDHLNEDCAFHRLFAGAGDRALIELHLDPLQLGVQAACEADRWARAVPLPGAPHAVMLAPEDQIVQLSVHVQKHGFSRLLWLKDLDLLIRARGDELDWDLIADIATREGVRASVWYALELTRKLLETPMPAAYRRLRPTLAARMLYAAVWPEARIARLEGSMRRRAVQFHAAEAWRGMLPSLLLMGRRTVRARMIARAVVHR